MKKLLLILCATILLCPGCKKDDDSCDHEIKHVDRIEPTCWSYGRTEEEYCLICGAVFKKGEIIDAVEHTIVIDPAVDPTCKDGRTEGSHCSICNRTIVYQNRIPAVHNLEILPAIAPSCTPGKTEGSYCTLCNKIIVAQKELPAVHEEETVPATDPTYDNPGHTEYIRCRNCGVNITEPEEITQLYKIGYPFEDTNGLTVTVISIEKEEYTGYIKYTLTYKSVNNKPDTKKIPGIFKLIYNDDTSESQTGFFDYLYYTESETRSYSWKVLKPDVSKINGFKYYTHGIYNESNILFNIE